MHLLVGRLMYTAKQEEWRYVHRLQWITHSSSFVRGFLRFGW